MTDKSCDTKCPGGHLSNVLCVIEKVLKIIVFAGLALVLFDVHGMLKAQKEYANAVTAAVSVQTAGMNADNGSSMATMTPATSTKGK